MKHWIVWGCNDENVQGGVTALENAGFKADDVIGVGLGAYLACKNWSSTKPSGMKAALFINGKDVGALAVQTMYDKLKNGKAFPRRPSPRPGWSTPPPGRPPESPAAEPRNPAGWVRRSRRGRTRLRPPPARQRRRAGTIVLQPARPP